MRKNTAIIALFLLAFIWCGVSVAAPLTPEQAKAEEIANARQHFKVMSSERMQHWSLDELDEDVIYSTGFDDLTGWTITDGDDDGHTWYSTADNTGGPDDNDYHSYFEDGEDAPYMWVDSDFAGSGVHLREILTGPTMDATGYDYVFLQFDTYYNFVSADSANIEYSLDGGTTWLVAETWDTDVEAYPYTLELTDFVANDEFMLRFVYDDGDSWPYFWALDNVTVIGNDGPLDLEGPEIELTSGPIVGYEGADEEVVAIATDDVSIASVTLSYGHYANGSITELTDIEMTATGNDNEFSALIPATFVSTTDTVVYSVSTIDGVGNEARDPADELDWFGYAVYDATLNYTLEQLESFEWIEVSESATDFEFGDDDHDPLVFADLGLGDFTWYGETYSQIEVYSNGWAAFGEELGTGTIFTGVMPNTSTPNGVLAPLAADLDPAEDVSGHVFFEVVDGKLVISWDDVIFYNSPDDSGPTTQIVLDFNTGAVNFNLENVAGYMDEEDPYTRSHTVGFESGDGTVGYTLYQGSDFGFPENMTSWTVSMPGGTLAGHVYEADGTTPISEATVTVLTQEEPATIVATGTTGEDGSYMIDVAPGTYDVQGGAFGFVDAITNDVEIVLDQETTVDFSLEAQEEIVTVAGTVMSADTEETPVVGAVVNVVGSGATGFTGADGSFSLSPDIPAGTYTVYITHNPIGSMGYHDVTLTGVVIDGDNLPLTLYMPEILAPQNVMASTGDGQVTVTWDPPANHDDAPTLRNGIETRRDMLRRLGSNLDPATLAKINVVRSELAILERRLEIVEMGSENGLDEISDFAGYLVMVDGEVMPDLVDDTEVVVGDLTNGHQYSFQIAADYDYNTESLSFSDPVVARPNSTPPYLVEDTDYEWVDIRPSEGGSGTMLLDEGDDANSGLLSMDGFSFTFYGTTYDEIAACSNGWVSFTNGTSGSIGLTLPSTTEPNALIAHFNEDTDVEAADDGLAIWGYHDEENNRYIVLYNVKYYGDETDTYLHELILDGDDNSMTFQYNVASNGWNANTINSIGIENTDGTEALVLPIETAADGAAVRIYLSEAEYGNIEGTITDADSGNPVDGAVVTAMGDSGAEYTAVSDEDGFYEVLEADQLDAPYTLEFRAAGYLDVTVEDVDWDEGEEYVHVEDVVMTAIDPSTPPSILSADGNYDNGIQVVLGEPGALVELDYLQHDDGIVGDATGWNPGYTSDYWFAAKFDVPGEGVQLQASDIRFLIFSDFDQWWPEGDESHQPVVIGVFNDDGSGMPGELVWTSDEMTPSEEDPTLEVMPNISVSSTFFIGFYNVTPEAGQEPLSLDGSNDNDVLYTSVDGGSTWNLSTSGDPFIRASVMYVPVGGTTPVVASVSPGEDNVKTEQANTELSYSVPVHGLMKRTAAPANPHFLPYAGELDEFVGFNVEYSLNGTDWTVANEELISGPMYFLEMGSENEDTEYSIRANAVVTDPEGGDNITSDYSDVTTATFNMAPGTPTALEGEADGLEISLSWTAPTVNADGSELVDLEQYSVWLLGEETELVGTSETTTFSTTMEAAGFYGFVVTAEDEVPNVSAVSAGIIVLAGDPSIETSFETGEWNELVADMVWEHGAPTAGPEAAHTGDNVWATVLGGDHGDVDEHANLETTAPLVVEHAGSMLTYWHWLDYENTWDGYNVKVSVDGTTWEIVEPAGGYPVEDVRGLGGENVVEPGFTGQGNEWQQVIIPLGAYEGEAIYVRFYHASDWLSVANYGAALDDMSFYGVQPPEYGTVTGVLHDCEDDGAPVIGADIWVDGRAMGVSATDGSFAVEVIAGSHIIEFHHDNFWDLVYEDQNVPADGELDMGDMVMTKPEADVDATTLAMTIPLGDTDPVSDVVVLENVGCGVMDYSVSVNILNAANEIVGSYPENVRPSDITEVADLPYFQTSKQSAVDRGPVAVSELDETWDLLDSFDADVISGAQDNLSAWIDGTSGYIMQFNAPYNIYEFDFSGNLLETHTPSTGGAQWWNEIEYDPTTGLVMTAAANGAIYQFMPDGSNATNIGTVGQDAWGLAYDYDNGIVYWANAYEQSAWGMLNLSTSQNTALGEPAPGGYPYAMMYVPTDPNGNTIYGAFSDSPTAGPVGIYGYNPTTQAWTSTPIATLYGDGSYGVVGMTGTHDWSGNLDFVLFGQGDGIADMVDIYEGSTLQSWLSVDPSLGTLLPGETANITVTVDHAADPSFQPVDGQNVTAQVIISGPKMVDTIVTVDMVFTTAGENDDLLPAKYALHQNYPNPFNPSTAIKFDLVASQNVKLTVFNMLGQEVARLVDGRMQAGYHNVSFDASRLASGVYFYRLQTPAFTKMRKMVLVK
ncbi:carboxypeptidase regulatory-like domain-containing protein [bacterium]|nr:carboxypeptidase regulatory-like domain-containing protein [bacterium]